MQSPAATSKVMLRSRFCELDVTGRSHPEISRLAGAQLLSMAAAGKALDGVKTLALFFAKLPEPDLLAAARTLESKGVRLAWPKVLADGLMEFYIARTDAAFEKGPFGIPEPPAGCPKVALDELDAMLVPALAYDFEGYRLGRGKGFYDRVLDRFKGVKIGVAPDAHVLDKLPREAWDRPVDFIVTDARLLDTRNKKENRT